MAYTMKDICAPRSGKDGKTYWHKVGTAFVGDDGKIGLKFDSLPLPNDKGEVSAQIFDRQSKDDRPARPAKGIAERKAGGGNAADLNDEIPF